MKRATTKPTKSELAAFDAHCRASADNFTDEKLLAKWDLVGERMRVEEPEAFTAMAEAVEATLVHHGDASTPATDWPDAGRKLINRDRRDVSLFAIRAHVFLDSQAVERRKRARGSN